MTLNPSDRNALIEVIIAKKFHELAQLFGARWPERETCPSGIQKIAAAIEEYIDVRMAELEKEPTK